MEQQDRELKEKLTAEAPFIASMAIYMAAAGVIRRGRFIRPPSSLTLSREWANASDSVLDWATGAIVPGAPHCFMTTAYLYGMYRKWCETTGHKPVASNEFGRRLSAGGYIRLNRNRRGFQVRVKTTSGPDSACG